MKDLSWMDEANLREREVFFFWLREREVHRSYLTKMEKKIVAWFNRIRGTTQHMICNVLFIKKRYNILYSWVILTVTK